MTEEGHRAAVEELHRFGVHQDNHEGLSRWLRDRGAADIADMFAELEQMRIGRWYGRQSNGDAAKRQDELLDAIAAWALA